MKIRMIVFYQAVRVDGESVKSFTPDENISDKTQHKGRSAEIQDKGVMLFSKSSNVLVPYNNVAYVEFTKEGEPSKASKSK